MTNTPVISTFHGAVDFGEHERFQALKYAAINAGANAVVSVSNDLLNEIKQRTSIKNDKVSVIYNGIDVSTYDRPRSCLLRQKFGWPDNEIIVGCLGNIRTAKRYDSLLQVAAIAVNSANSYRFVIAGQCEGPLFDQLLQLRGELGLQDRVQFLGFVDDAAEFLSNLDIFLSTSDSEGLPLSAIQAMAAEFAACCDAMRWIRGTYY